MVKGARLVLPVLALAGGCAAIAGLDRDYREGNGSDPGEGGGSSTGGGLGCELAQPPGPSMIENGEGPDFLVAFRQIGLGENENGIQFGYDLDGVCTDMSGVPASCAPPPLGKTPGDGPGGIDNGADGVFTALSNMAGSPLTSGAVTEQAKQGFWSLLLRVRGYSGQPDDDQVELAVYTTPGIRDLSGPPAWMGTDEWPVFRSALADQATLDTPAIFDPQAYVSGGVLVGRIARMPLQFRSSTYSLTITLSQVVISATVEPAEGGYRLTNGTLAGSWGVPDIFQGLSEFRLFGQAICTDSDEYTSIKPAFCDQVDMRVEGGAPEEPCNAVSFGLSFLAEPALLYVDPFDDEVVTPVCDPTLDPMFDNCDQ